MKNLVARVHLKLADLSNRESQKGATAVEYALIVGLIAVVIIVGVSFLGGTISGIFKKVGSEISSRV